MSGMEHRAIRTRTVGVQRRDRPRWLRLSVGLAMVLGPAFILVTRWSAVVAGHRSYLVVVVATGAIGAGAVVSGVFARRSAPDPPGTSSVLRRAFSVIGALVGLALVAVLLWARPFTATPVALDALRSGSDVSVLESATRIELAPTGARSPTGLVFYPGARVDARAYSAILRPIAASGYLVVIVKLPFGIAFADVNAAQGVIDDHREVDRWVVAGHSLGGAVGSQFADDHRGVIAGLLFWASFPTRNISGVPFSVASVSGTEDGLATPGKIDASRADLPPATRFTAIEGAVHADFGDYGPQAGDGTPSIDRESAQRRIVAASLELLRTIDR